MNGDSVVQRWAGTMKTELQTAQTTKGRPQSCCGAVVVSQQSAKPLLAGDVTWHEGGQGCGFGRWRRGPAGRQWLIAETLMRPVSAIEVHVGLDDVPHVLLAEDDEMVKALLPEGISGTALKLVFAIQGCSPYAASCTYESGIFSVSG